MSNKIPILKLIRRNLGISILFVLSTAFFIYQNKINLSWDFASYILNAKYLFYDGIYFEIYRSPIPVVLFGIFLLFGKLSSYLYIIFTSSLFLYSNISLADAIFENPKLNKGLERRYLRFLFYFFSLSAFTLIFGLMLGTELLSLAFFELFLAFLIRGRVSGHFLALAVLSRYNFLFFSFFLLFNKNYKKILANIALFFAILFPWLLFNYIKFGNWFASIVDSYAMNIFFRDYLIQPFNPLVILEVIGLYLPFLILGLIISTIYFIKQKNKLSKSNRIILLFALTFILLILEFERIPLKFERYLFNLTLPVAFFSTLSMAFLINKFKKIKKLLVYTFVIVFIITTLTLANTLYQNKHHYDRIFAATEDIEKLDLKECRILSPHWVPLHYLTGNAYPLGGNLISESVWRNEIVLIFKNYTTMDDSFTQEEIETAPKLYETESYIFLAKENLTKHNCARTYVYDPLYTTEHCEIIASKFTKLKLENLALKFCKAINKKENFLN
ncbi:MAG: hypothetical protein ABIH92_00205 [Nanoarchaeota archaeon]